MAQAAVGRSSGAEPGFRREVGLTALMFVSLGSIIGSGWLLGALTAATSAGGASIASWLLAGVVIVRPTRWPEVPGAGRGWRSARCAGSPQAGWPGFKP